MKRVYTADSLVDGQLVRDLLEGNWIPCELFHPNAIGALGELPVTPPEVWVRRDQDAERAIVLVAKLQQPTDSGSRLCSGCQETSPASFDICWQCQASFD